MLNCYKNNPKVGIFTIDERKVRLFGIIQTILCDSDKLDMQNSNNRFTPDQISDIPFNKNSF